MENSSSRNLSEAELLAYRISELQGTEVWSDLKTLFSEKVASLNTLEGIKTLKELDGRREAIKILNNFWGTLELLSSVPQKITRQNLSKEDQAMRTYKVKE